MRWDALCKFAKVKEARLGSAKAQAEEFQVSTRDILDWLTNAETSLRLNQQLPDDEFQLQVSVRALCLCVGSKMS